MLRDFPYPKKALVLQPKAADIDFRKRTVNPFNRAIKKPGQGLRKKCSKNSLTPLVKFENLGTHTEQILSK